MGSADILKMSAEYCMKISERKPRKKILSSGWEKLARTLNEIQTIESSVTVDRA
jgi:hypothetical protein